MDTIVEAVVAEHALHILDATGDTKMTWDASRQLEVDNARATFDKLRNQGYMAYRVLGKSGDKGEVMRDFDPAAERIILAPATVGG